MLLTIKNNNRDKKEEIVIIGYGLAGAVAAITPLIPSYSMQRK
ncbi:MAG: hypothetical protein V3V23_04300 [Dehalococcoidales bacterium]